MNEIIKERNQLLKELSKISKYFNSNLKFTNQTHINGCFNIQQRTIFISHDIVYSSDVSLLLSTFFHELAHVFKMDNGIFLNYYKEDEINYKQFSSIALRAEKETDRIGECLMYMFFPENVFIHTYNNIKENHSDFWKNLLLTYKEHYEVYELLKKAS